MFKSGKPLLALVIALLLCSPMDRFVSEVTSNAAAGDAGHDDPFLWLEDVGGERALAWVREQNGASVRELETAGGFDRL
ncbi:MAG: hypothetical protein FJ143_19185, partial [Deltaproteobacteria bacterium]|nr:hypothetical protein [Deltaproteobacteria bacterium]